MAAAEILFLHYWEQKSSRFSFLSSELDLAKRERHGAARPQRLGSRSSAAREHNGAGSLFSGTGEPHPPFFRGASPNLSRTESLHSLGSQLLCHFLKRRGGDTLIFCLSQGNRQVAQGSHPHPEAVPAVNNTLRGRSAGQERSPLRKPRPQGGEVTAPST